MANLNSISKLKLILLALYTCIWFVLFFVLFLEQEPFIPVEGASLNDWNPDSFWAEPWGISGVHKGIDIFARKGTVALSAVSGLVVYQGELELGGKVVKILGPKWHLHYYAHLDTISVSFGQWVPRGQMIGNVGKTGNARTPHLHYSVLRLIPNPKQYSTQTQGWKRMFYLNPDRYLR